MKFRDITIQNFLTIGEAKVSLSDRGLVLVQGSNQDDTSADSNGAGKSSFGDALSFCLYGTTARGESGDDVVNNIALKDCAVSVYVEDGDDHYIIARHRKHKTYKNALHLHSVDPVTGAQTALTKGTDKLTQIEVDRIIGCSYEVFKSSIYAGQNSMPDLPGMTDKQLKLLVEEAAGTTILDAAYEKARVHLAAQKAAMLTATGALANNKIRIEELTAREVDLQAREKHANEEKAAQIVTMRANAGVHADAAKAYAAKLASFDREIIESSIKECDDAIAAVASEHANERRLSADASDAAIKVASAKSKLASLKSQHDKAKLDITAAEHKVGCPCDECGRPITAAEVAPARAAATKRANDIAAQYNEARKLLEASIAAHKSVADGLEAFRATMTDVSATSARRASLSDKLNERQSIERARDASVKEAKTVIARCGEIAKSPNPYEAMVIEAQAKLAEEVGKAPALQMVQREAEKQLRIAEEAAKVFSPTGVRGQVLDEVTPYLNDQTAKYLSTLSDGNIRATWTTLVTTKKGDLKEQFAIEVENDKGGKKFGLISGGEQRKVQIAAAMALQDLVATRAAKQIDLFIGDEIDNALDPAGLERLIAILEEKARERGSVFIISHNSLKDWISNCITVVKTGGISHIVETSE